MANKTGKATTVALLPASGGTWAATAGAVGALDGIYLTSIDELHLQGDPTFDQSIGIAQLQESDRTIDEANPTLTLPMRWNGVQWAIFAQMIGSDTLTGSDPYTHTMTYLEEPVAVMSTMALGIDTDTDGTFEDFIEWPSLKFVGMSLEPDGEGFWQLTANTIGNTILYEGDAANGDTQLGAVTYQADQATSRMRFKGISIKTAAQGSNPTGETAKSVAEVTLNFTRPFERNDTVSAVTTGVEKQTAEPVQNGHPEITFSWNEITEYTAIGDFDDLQDETALTGDFEMAETISSQSLTFLFEMPNMVRMAASAALESGNRIPTVKNYACAAASSTPTGQATANRVHFIVVNGDNVDYDAN